MGRVQGDLQAMHKAGLKGARLCGLPSPGTQHLKDYLWLALLNDPYQDAWAIIDDFCDFQYGQAAAAVEKYLRELGDLWKLPQMFMTIDKKVNTMRIYKPEWIVK